MAKQESSMSEAPHTLRGRSAPRHAADIAQAFAQAAGLQPADGDRLCVIVEELVANVFEHGGATVARLALRHHDGSVGIELTDDGAAFDLRTAPLSHVRPARGGGAGLAIVRAWTDALGYERHGQLNISRLALRRHT
jgi:serine/threonine-protein kinase RsbW